MDAAPVLSICIATMNRPNLLDETLASLRGDSGPGVEWIIVDGSSDQQTFEVVKKWQASFPAITYHHASPQGIDRDYSLSLGLARGMYCWLMTDDDLVAQGAIQAILAATKNKYALIVLNASVFNTDFTECFETALLKLHEDREYPPSQFGAFFEDAASYLSFIGGVIIRRDVWNSRSISPYFGTEFIHVGVIFQQPFSEPVFVIAKPYIQIRYGNALWWRRAFRIWMFNWPNLIWSFPHFSDEAKSKVCDPTPYRRMNELVKNRAKGCYSLVEYREWVEPKLTNRLQKFAAFTIACLPGRLVNSVSIAYLKFRYPESRALLLDFQRSRYYKQQTK